MPKPSIKGAALVQLVEDVRKLATSERLLQRDLEARLDPGDLDLLEEEVRVAAWYDVRCYARMIELLRDVEGGGSNDYVRERGYAAARRLIAAGVYPQMDYLSPAQVSAPMDAEARAVAFGTDLRLLVSLSASIFNFSSWLPLPDPDHANRFRIEVRGAGAFPDALGWSAEGFLNAMATRHGAPDLWRWVRQEPDFVLFRMIRSP